MRRLLPVFVLCLVASPAYAVSLTSYYKLDDATPLTTTTTATATIGANGTYVGGFAVGDFGQDGSPGDPSGKSVHFQDTGVLNRRILVPARGGTNGTNLTISMWVQFNSNSRDMALANNDTTWGASNLNIFRDDDSTTPVATNTIVALLGGETRGVAANNSANDTDWHLISVSYNTSNPTDAKQIFIDGVRSTLQITGDTDAVSAVEIALGNIRGTGAASQQLGGSLDEVAFWSQALNDSEQQALFVLNTNNLNNIDAAGAAALFYFFANGSPGGSTTVDGTNFMFVPDVTTFGVDAGESMLVGSQLVLGLSPSGSGLVSLAVPEPTSIGLWALLGALAVGVAYRRVRQR